MLIKAERDHYFKIRTTAFSSDNVASTCASSPSDLDSQTQSEYNSDADTPDTVNFGHIRKLLYYLSRHHLDANDWKKLARFWDFTEEQIKAIEHQYTGKTSYKDHAYRMLLIWLHGLSSTKNPLDEMYDALIYINKQDVAEKIRRKAEESQFYKASRFRCRCLPAIPSGMCHYCCII